MTALTEQQKANLRNIYRKAKSIIAEHQRRAVQTSNFDESMRSADRQAALESYLRKLGVDLDAVDKDSIAKP